MILFATTNPSITGNLHTNPTSGSNDESGPATRTVVTDAALISDASSASYLTPEGLMAYCP